MNEAEDDIAIVKTAYFEIVMLRPSLAVLAVPHKAIPKCAWWLLREYGRYSFEEKRCKDLDISNHSTSGGEKHRGFGLILYDDDGLTVISEAKKISTVKYLLRPEEFTLSPFYWKAFIISMRGSAVEIPGAVYSLANALSNEGLSILHISTFDSEVFLIQEPDLEKACRILKEFEDPRVINEILEKRYGDSHDSLTKEQSLSKDAASMSPLQGLKEEEDLEEEDEEDHEDERRKPRSFYEADQSASMDNDDDINRFDLSWITPQVKSTISLPNQLSEAQILSSLPSRTKFDEGFTLCVLPTAMIMAKCDRSDMRIYSDLMIKMILYDERYSNFSSAYTNEGCAVSEEEILMQGGGNPLKHQQSEYFLPSEDSSDAFLSTLASSEKLPPHPPVSSANAKSKDDVGKGPAKKSETARANFMYGLWYAHDEVTFLFHENDLAYFPQDQLIISPQQWKVIKLCGRPIAFNETGVVSAMSQVDTNIPSLNISTAQTNCTLVPYELLTSTVDSLSITLNCPVHFTPPPKSGSD